MIENNTDKFKKFTRGGQIFFHNFRMWFQVNQTLFKICKVIWFLLTILFTWLITPKHIYMSAWYWCQAQVYPILKLLDIELPIFRIWYHTRFYYIHPSKFLHTGFVKFVYKFPYYLTFGVGFGLIGSIIAFWLISKLLTKKGEDQTADKYIRGDRVDKVKNVIKQIKRRNQASDIVIDKMPIVAGTETRHFLVHGATGTGKTQLISKFLDNLRRMGERAVVFDLGGIYTSIYYRKNLDRILNPMDARSENWDLWSEAVQAQEFASLAASLIPRPTHADQFWADSARTVFANAAYTIQDKNDRSIKNLLTLLLTVPLSDLYKFLAKTNAATLMNTEMEKTALSIRSVMATYVKGLAYLTGLEKTNKNKFSIKDWLEDESRAGDWLFITTMSEHHEALKALVSMWFSIASIYLMRPSKRTKRIWFICDELPGMHQLPYLSTVLAQGRKYGGCFVLGMQSYAQIEAIYERSGAQSIFDNLLTRFFFRSASSQMAELVSKELGTQEVRAIQESYSYGANNIRDGIVLNSQIVTKQVVMPSEIMELEPMICYLRHGGGGYPISKLELKIEKRESVESEFVPGEVPDQEISAIINNMEFQVRKIKIATEPGEIKQSEGKQEEKEREKKEESQKAEAEATESSNKAAADSSQNNTSGIKQQNKQEAEQSVKEEISREVQQNSISGISPNGITISKQVDKEPYLI